MKDKGRGKAVGALKASHGTQSTWLRQAAS
jgi:hypothetical protein